MLYFRYFLSTTSSLYSKYIKRNSYFVISQEGIVVSGKSHYHNVTCLPHNIYFTLHLRKREACLFRHMTTLYFDAILHFEKSRIECNLTVFRNELYRWPIHSLKSYIHIFMKGYSSTKYVVFQKLLSPLLDSTAHCKKMKKKFSSPQCM